MKEECALSSLDTSLPNINVDALQLPDRAALGTAGRSTHMPRILRLYGLVLTLKTAPP